MTVKLRHANFPTARRQSKTGKRGARALALVALFGALFGAAFDARAQDSAAGTTTFEHLNFSVMPALGHAGLAGAMSAVEAHAARVPGAPLVSASIWTRGEYGAVEGGMADDGGPAPASDWDGDARHLYLGADFRLGDLLLGVMASQSAGEVEYKGRGAGAADSGDYSHSSAGGSAYFAWSSGATGVWGIAGSGGGEVEAGAQIADTSESSAALSIKQTLVEGLAIRADASYIEGTVEEVKDASGDVRIEKQDINSMRGRLLLVGEHSHRYEKRVAVPRVEIGARYGAVETEGANIEKLESTSAGVEAAMGVDFVNSASGLTMSVNGRFYDGDELTEWGLGGGLEKRAGADGRGLSFRLRRDYGSAQIESRELPEMVFDAHALHAAARAESRPASRMSADIAYGFAARGVLTPYAGAVIGDASSDYRIGLRWLHKRRFDFTLRGERSEGARAVVLRGKLDF